MSTESLIVFLIAITMIVVLAFWGLGQGGCRGKDPDDGGRGPSGHERSDHGR